MLMYTHTHTSQQQQAQDKTIGLRNLIENKLHCKDAETMKGYNHLSFMVPEYNDNSWLVIFDQKPYCKLAT